MTSDDPEKPPKPMRLFAKLSERVDSDGEAISEDERLKKFEASNTQFMSRFAGFLTSKKT